jgi:hypothetical protein
MEVFMGWIDSDAHVVETPQTWECLSASEAKFRPMLVQSADGLLYWFTDRKILEDNGRAFYGLEAAAS